MPPDAPTTVIEVRDGQITRYTVSPEEVSLPLAPGEEIPGGDPAANAETARRIFGGETGPARDLAVLNAAAAIYVGGGASSLAEGVQAAQSAIDSGAAAETVERFVAATHEPAA